jgi:hypothetical protein
LPQVLGPLRPPEFRSRDHFLPTRDFLPWRKLHRRQANRRELAKVGLIFTRSGAMVDCAAQ